MRRATVTSIFGVSGVLKSIDGGTSWRVMGNDLRGRQITAITPSTYRNNAGQTVSVLLVATKDGIFRNEPGSNDFLRVELRQDGNFGSEVVTDIESVPDPQRPGHNIFFAASSGYVTTQNSVTVGAGVYGGQSWTNITSGRVADPLNQNAHYNFDSVVTRQDPPGSPKKFFEAKKILMAAHADGQGGASTRRLYIGVVDHEVNDEGRVKNRLDRVFRSDSQGTNETLGQNWTFVVDTPGSVGGLVDKFRGLQPEGAGDRFFSFAVDPSNRDSLYFGGDAQDKHTIGSHGDSNVSGFVGRLFHLDASQDWMAAINGNRNRGQQIVGSGASAPAPELANCFASVETGVCV